jgi:ribose 5-phosphate isomerase A
MTENGKAYMTDNGNPYLHCRFPPELLGDPAAVDMQLRALAGVVGTGLFVGMAAEAMVAKFDGGIETLRPRK